MAGKKPVAVSPSILKTLQAAKNIGDLSDGAFDVTFLAVGKLWSLKPEHPIIPDDDAIQKALGLVNYRDLVLDEEAGTAFLPKEGMLLDLGGIAKGTAVDLAIRSLKGSGIENALVNAAGDIYALGNRPDGTPWKVGIQDPRKKPGLLGELRVSNRSVSTSGDYERMVIIDGKRYHHIINPRTGKPSEGVISVTIVAPSAEEADGLATAVFLLGVEKGLALAERIPNVEALVIDSDGKRHPSSGFNAFLAENASIAE
jgi:thiamine biosynthesis lipoprotein